MSSTRFIDSTRIPFVREGFYATNNQFQRAGPKGFIQVKILENDDVYVRVDLPGVPDDAIQSRVDSVRQKVVFFTGETLSDENETKREYSGTAGLGCDCCEITNVKSTMKDGVLRIVASRVKVKDAEEKCTLTLPPFTGKSGRYLEDHPFVVKGRKGATLAKLTAEGGLYFVVDVPSVSADDIDVFVHGTEIRFYAENRNVYEHDESGRIYLGSVNSPAASPSADSFTWEAKHGVLKINISPP